MSQSDAADADKQWYDFTSHFVQKLIDHRSDWAALREEEQDLAALWKLEADMYNGGFVQFFCNWGYECYGYATRCLARIGAAECLGIVEKAYGVIERLSDDERLQGLWDIPAYLTAEELAQLDALDNAYWENTDQVAQKTLAAYAELLKRTLP
jgi:hypothetical protein